MAGDRKDWVKDSYMSCSLSSIASKASDREGSLREKQIESWRLR